MSLFSGIYGNHGYADSTVVNSAQGTIVSSSGQTSAGALPSLSVGQTVEGKVISANGDTVQIDIGTGTPVTARLEHAMGLQSGQNVIFEVKANSSQQLTLSPLYTNLTNASTALNALNAAEMVVNSDTLSMTSAMMDAGMGIDKTSLANMYHLVSGFPGHQPADIIQMQQMGLEIDESSLQQFEAFKNYEIQIGEGMQQIASDISKMYGELIASGNEDAAMQFMKAAIDIFAQEEFLPDDGMPQEAQETAMQEGEAVSGKADSLEGNAVPNAADLLIQDMKTTGNLGLEQTGKLPEEQLLAEEKAQEKQAADPEAVKQEIFMTGRDAAAVGNPADSQEQLKMSLLNLLKETQIPSKQLEQMAKQPTDAQELLRLASRLTQQAQQPGMSEELAAKIKNGLRDVFLSEGFQSTLRQAVQKQWFLEPSEVADKESVESLYKRLEQQTRQLTDALSGLARPESPLAQDLSNMNQNMNFMNQMNQIYQYIQIPLKMHGGEATGDLFVYSDRKSLAQKDGNVSALLHLNMQNLGMVDVYASMTAGNNVFTRFYLENDEMLDFIEANIHILNERLTGRGYHLTTEMAKHDEKNDLMANPPVKREGAAPKAVIKQRFDIRA